MSVRPWFVSTVRDPSYIGRQHYFHLKVTPLGGLVTEQAHWHRTLRSTSVAWCRCGGSIASSQLPKMVEPTDLEPLTARAARVLKHARGLHLLHRSEEEEPFIHTASGEDLDKLAEYGYGLPRGTGETDRALRFRLYQVLVQKR